MGIFDDISALITGAVGNNRDNNTDDVLNVKRRLSDQGLYDLRKPPEPHGYITADMDSAIRSFQKSKGLKVDGYLLPGGETEAALRQSALAENAASFASPLAQKRSRNEESREVGYDATGRMIRPEELRPKSRRVEPQEEEEREPSPLGFSIISSAQAAEKRETIPVPPRKPKSIESLAASERASSEENIPLVPSYRKEVFKGSRAKEWTDFNKTVESRADLNSFEKRMMRDIFAAEGGMAAHKGSGAYAGILQSTLRDHIKAGNLPDIVKKHGQNVKNTDLDMNDVVDVYKSHLDDTMASAIKGYKIRNPDAPKNGTQLLGDLGNKVGGAVADTLFKNAGKEGSKMIIKAINQNFPPDEQLTDPQDIGSKTYEALKKIAADRGKTKSFLESLSLIRVKDEKNGKNEMGRIYYPVLEK